MPSWEDFKPFIVTGLALGGVYALSGVGTVVLYRATGVLNLAFGAVGAMGAFISWSLIDKGAVSDGVAFLICVLFAVAANGLLKLRRWGWALTLAAAFLSMTYAAVMLFLFHQIPMIAMMLINLVFFLYLIRPEVLERVK